MTESPFTVDPLRMVGSERRWSANPYELPALPYPTDSLNGFLSAEILELHHDRDHRADVDGLNRALSQLADARYREDYSATRVLTRAVAFHGSGHVLHTLYWHSMSPTGGVSPRGELKDALEASFGSVDRFRAQFTAAAGSVEADGWGILAYEPLGAKLVVLASESHENHAFQGTVPLLVCDVWEHAYQLRYRERRSDYLRAFHDVIHWDFAAERFARALDGRA